MADEKVKHLPTNNDQLEEEELEVEVEEDGGSEFDASQLFRSAVKVLYCGVCGVPPEYCEFNGPRVFSNCRSWLKRFHPTAYQELGYQKFNEEEEEAKKKKKNALKPQRIDPPPHSRFQPWAHIYAFHRISAGYLNTKEVLSVRGKIKLHGTNAAVNVHFEAPKNRIETFAQSRNRFVVKDNENYGFSSFVKTNTPFFSSILTTLRNSSEEASGHGEWIRTMTVFGEWCGKGINKGASICTLERKIFAIFSIQLNSDLTIYDPETILQLLQLSSIPRPKDLHILPYATSEMRLDFGEMESLVKRIEEMNGIVEAVDREDPWVTSTFKVAGPGEGLVWYPFDTSLALPTLLNFDMSSSSEGVEAGEKPEKVISPVEEAAKLREKFGGKIVPLSILNLLFKTKGPTHSVVQQKHCVQLTPAVATTVEQFVDMFVTKNRLEQTLQETRGHTLSDNSGSGGGEGYSKSSRHQRKGGKGKDIAKIQPTTVREEGVSETVKLSRQLPHFIKWLVNDVKREGQDELVASDLKWEEVAVAIEVAARRWFQAEVLNRCGTGSSASASSSSSSPSSLGAS